MVTPRNIGLLLCRDEIDVVDEFMPRHVEFFDTIVAIDESSDGSRERLLAWPQVRHLIRGEELPYPRPLRDGMRQAALELIRREYGYGGWITVLHPDEWWVDDPNRAAADAEREGAECVLWHALQFYLHVSQRPLYERPGWQAIPVRRRLDRFQPGFYEYRQFRNLPGADYDPQRHSQTIPASVRPSAYLRSYSPVLAHYSLRSPGQAAARTADRLARRWNTAYDALRDSVFLDIVFPAAPLLGCEHEMDAWLRAFPTFGRSLP